MNCRPWLIRLVPGLLVLAAVLATAMPADAVTYNLVAKRSTATMPGGVNVDMWGFEVDTGQSCAVTPGWSVGPKLLVDPGDSLTVNLRNCLTTPVSIVIAGQALADGSAPVRHSGGQFAGRVRSFTREAGAAGGTQTYTWSNLKAGTYLYHSGTQPQVQVQMGLYGPVTKDAGVGQAYPTVPYTQQRDLFFSEIDPALHAAVTNGTYGALPGPTSTLDYHPKYFLVNGAPFSPGTACLDGLAIGDGVLLRLYNAGLRELAPMMLGSHFHLVAEGGSQSPFRQERYTVLLQPGSTKDLLFQAAREGRFPIIERRLNLTNRTAPNGGMQTCLLVGNPAPPPGGSAPVASNGSATTNEDTAVGVTLAASDADGDPLTYAIVTGPANGSLSGTPPNLTFTPAANFFGSTSFTFTANDGQAASNVATVFITVNAVNDAPSFTAGANQTVTQPAGAQKVANWATAISRGPANEAAQSVSFLVSNDNNALFSTQPAVAPNGTLTYTPATGAAGVATLTVSLQDNGGTANGGVDTSAAQIRTITLNAGTPTGGTIFQDGFESGSFAAWSGILDADGDLSAVAGAALSGAFGMAALIDDNTSMWVRDDSPNNETRYRARFYFDPNGIVMANGNTFGIMSARSANLDAGVDIVRVELRRSNNLYQVRAITRHDSGAFTNTGWYTIPDAPTHIEIDWGRATAAGANNGFMSLWTAGVFRQTLHALDNDTLRVNSARLGPLQGIDTGTRGTVYFDGFISRRSTFIGP